MNGLRPGLESARLAVERWVNGRNSTFPGSLAADIRASVGAAEACESKELRVPNEITGAEDLSVRRLVLDALRDALTKAPLPPGMHAILHGSFATGVVTPFSDVDIVLIFDEKLEPREAPRLRAACAALLRVMYRSAPLAHHGLTVIFRGELERYDQSVLPLATLERGLQLSGVALTLPILWDPVLSRSCAHARFERQLAASRRNFQTHSGFLYRRQSALSVLMLLPSLLVESVDGAYPYKGDSFALAKERFRPEEWAAIEEATAIRRAWRLPPRLTGAAAILNSSDSILGPEFARKITGALSWDPGKTWGDELPKSAFRFIERCEEMLHARR